MKKGFTLIELIVVVIILGVLVTVALPRLTSQVERSRASEATNLLGTLRSSNERYASLNADSYLVNATCTGLDASYTTPRNFDAPNCSDAVAGIITMQRLPAGAGYSLQIDAEGCLCCNEVAGDPNCTDAVVPVCPSCL